jgi:hypothetical protein
MCLRTFQIDDMIKNFVKNLQKKSNPRKLKNKKFFGCPHFT